MKQLEVRRLEREQEGERPYSLYVETEERKKFIKGRKKEKRGREGESCCTINWVAGGGKKKGRGGEGDPCFFNES